MAIGDGQNNKPTIENGLTPKQSAFIDYYIETLNGSQSYTRAFSTPNRKPTRRTAEVNASKLLKHPNVQPIIEERMKAMENERQANAAEVIEFLTNTMRDEQEKTSERLRAAELIGKRHALFTDKLDTNQNVDIEINLMDDDEPEPMDESDGE